MWLAGTVPFMPDNAPVAAPSRSRVHQLARWGLARLAGYYIWLMPTAADHIQNPDGTSFTRDQMVAAIREQEERQFPAATPGQLERIDREVAADVRRNVRLYLTGGWGIRS